MTVEELRNNEVNIDVKAIPWMVIDDLSQYLISAVKEMFKDPAIVAEFKEWRKSYEAPSSAEAQPQILAKQEILEVQR